MKYFYRIKIIPQTIFFLVSIFGVFGDAVASPLDSIASLQGEFRGPVDLKVWKHWQQSWNVEEQNLGNDLFKLSRGLTADGRALVVVQFVSKVENLVATLSSELQVRTGEWDVASRVSKTQMVTGIANGGVVEFIFRDAKEFLDISESQFVTSLNLKISTQNQLLLEQGFIPMYVRGKGGVYWDNSIDAYRAHAGQGDIKVATATASERSGYDLWNGVAVKPILNFIERNTLGPSSEVGLHRHQANQELYFVESGSPIMHMGVVPVTSPVYKTLRKWEGSSARLQETDEFKAGGGWIESRTIFPGQYSVIVPKPEDQSHVYFHGIQSAEPSVFWTMGTKN